MKPLLITAILLIRTIAPTFAQTEPGPILLHVTESDSTRTFSFGFYLDKDQTPAGLYFEDYHTPGEAGIQRFPFQTLNTPQVFYTKRGYDVAKMAYADSVLTVLFKKDVRQGDDAWIKREFQLSCDQSYHCVTTDGETHAIIQGVELMIHYSRVLGFNVATGVDSIQGFVNAKRRHRRLALNN